MIDLSRWPHTIKRCDHTIAMTVYTTWVMCSFLDTVSANMAHSSSDATYSSTQLQQSVTAQIRNVAWTLNRGCPLHFPLAMRSLACCTFDCSTGIFCLGKGACPLLARCPCRASTAM